MLKNYFNKILLNLFIVILIFSFDRLTKLYIINLVESDQFVDIYINPLLFIFITMFVLLTFLY